MICNAKKGSENLYVSYSNGNFTSELFGKQFSVENKGGYTVFRIDLSKNAKAKSSKQSHDMEELVEDKAKLKTVEISDQSIVGLIRELPQAVLQSNWILELLVDKEKAHSYSINKTIDGYHIIFAIDKYLGDKKI